MQLNLHPFTSEEQALAWARSAIDSAASNARSKYVADANAASYSAKYEQAIAWLDRKVTNPDFCVWIKADAEAHQRTMDESATIIRQKGDAWSNAAPQIEALRVSGKSALVGLTVDEIIESCRETIKKLDKI